MECNLIFLILTILIVIVIVYSYTQDIFLRENCKYIIQNKQIKISMNMCIIIVEYP